MVESCGNADGSTPCQALSEVCVSFGYSPADKVIEIATIFAALHMCLLALRGQPAIGDVCFRGAKRTWPKDGVMSAFDPGCVKTHWLFDSRCMIPPRFAEGSDEALR
jgi:hypothetical protein